ncbi:hypothetical protein [Bradyrhizobium septentrionale]|uniref:Uncharacterized protein n=2 Tax=Bradyrhizobium septentrionale TaxID=1404411 RepID=A0A973VWZ5_9BRAD|nr:hypothetical protein [Bradyrhizobium septentrionale]UGY12157.1 hypothetical protein HAP48_0025780 [Bradyrhizobium septentrionale]
MSKYISSVVVGLLAWITVRIIAGAFGLNEKALQLGYWLPHLSAEQRSFIVSSAAVLIGIIAVVLWLALNADDRIRNLLSSRPELGSLRVEGKPTAKMAVYPRNPACSVELGVDLFNTMSKLMEVEGKLFATINGKDLDQPMDASFPINGNASKTLFVRMEDVPVRTVVQTDGLEHHLSAHLRYELTYRYANAKHSRRTCKTVSWTFATRAAPENPGARQTVVMPVIVHFSDEIEE